MNTNRTLFSAGADAVRRNLRYLVWFYLFSLLFAWVGATGFGMHAHSIMDHSLYSDKLLHGFHIAVLVELLNRPEFGPTESSTAPAIVFAVSFLWLNLTFMPGVLLGYSSDHRISRGEFFRACGRNLWRFVRLFILAAIVTGVVGGILIAGRDALVKAAEATNYERLPFAIRLSGLFITLMALNMVRAWFDVAQTDVVLSDQKAVRKSLASAFGSVKRNFGKLFVAYIGIAFMGLVVLICGIVLWNLIVPSASVAGAFIISQVITLLLLAMRFWQRAAAVAFYLQQKAEPAMEAMAVTPVVA